MLIKKPNDIKPSEITDESLYLDRRRFIKGAAALGIGAAAGASGAGLLLPSDIQAKPAGDLDYPNLPKSKFNTSEDLTPYDKVTSYNNFYEFGTGKNDPVRYAKNFVTKPWSVTIDGEVENAGTFDLEDVLKHQTLEERIYRLRCVEAWSMVIPWVGFPLAELLKRHKPTSKAKYVAFETLYDPKQMPGQKNSRSLDWPYVEGLRIDEAMNPLTLMSVGLYGKEMPNQNGAPIRLVVPWKYGFKSIKSIVRITLTEKEPPTSWNISAPNEYGFYSNVNPQVSHPRWSQSKERRLGGGFFSGLVKQETLMFNGYADQVAHLYAGMDLKKHY